MKIKLEMLESFVEMARGHFHWEGGIPKQVEFRNVKNHYKYHEDLLDKYHEDLLDRACVFKNLCRDVKEQGHTNACFDE